MRACARQASAEDPQNNGPLFQHTPESERGGERARSLEDYKRADFIKPEGRDGGVREGWKEIRMWHSDEGGGVKNVEKEGCRFEPQSEMKAKWKLTWGVQWAKAKVSEGGGRGVRDCVYTRQLCWSEKVTTPAGK